MFTNSNGELYNPVNRLRQTVVHVNNVIRALEELKNCIQPILEYLNEINDSISKLTESASFFVDLQGIGQTARDIRDEQIQQQSLVKKEVIDLTSEEPDSNEADVTETQPAPRTEEEEVPNVRPSCVTYRNKNKVVKILQEYKMEDRLLNFEYKGKQKKGFVLDIINSKTSEKLFATFLHFDDDTNEKYWRSYIVGFIKPIIKGPRCIGCAFEQPKGDAHVGEDGCMSS